MGKDKPSGEIGRGGREQIGGQIETSLARLCRWSLVCGGAVWLAVVTGLLVRPQAPGARPLLLAAWIASIAAWVVRRFSGNGFPVGSRIHFHAAAAGPSVESEIGSSPPAEQSQRRWRLDDREVIHGTVRVRFGAGERHQTAHVSFCPPLRSVPTIEVECVGGAEGTVAVAKALWHGAVLDVRLHRALDHESMLDVEYHAQE